jgi:hypothetical protein
MKIHAPDLNQRPPRSPRVRLGGFAILPRMLDKGRATIMGKAGEFNFNCPLDQRFLSFAGIDALQLKKQLARDKSDGEMLDWIKAHAKKKRSAIEIAAWSAAQEQRVATDLDSRKLFNEYQAKLAPKRKDVATWFDILDIDDFVTFGGKA